MERLSERDRAVLNTIFDPLQGSNLGFGPFLENTVVTNDDQFDALETSEVEEKLETDVVDIVKQAILKAEMEQFEESFRLFEEALNKAPRSASILNDRAQALRLAARDEEALRDLDLAVEISKGKGKAGVRALCQRGALYRSKKEDEKARQDFNLAAKAGSTFAKSQLVALNPYAAMCNAMLSEISIRSAAYSN